MNIQVAWEMERPYMLHGSGTSQDLKIKPRRGSLFLAATNDPSALQIQMLGSFRGTIDLDSSLGGSKSSLAL